MSDMAMKAVVVPIGATTARVRLTGDRVLVMRKFGNPETDCFDAAFARELAESINNGLLEIPQGHWQIGDL